MCTPWIPTWPRSAGALGTVYIIQLDGDGNEIEKWTLWNSFITKVDYGALQYEAGEGLVEISLDIAYDWARLEVLNSKGSMASAGNQGTEFFNG